MTKQTYTRMRDIPRMDIIQDDAKKFRVTQHWKKEARYQISVEAYETKEQALHAMFDTSTAYKDYTP